MTKASIDQFIVALATIVAAVILFVWPGKSELAQLIVGTIAPMLSILAGIIYVWIKGQQNVVDGKVELAKLELATAQARAAAPKAASTSSGGYTYTLKDVDIMLKEVQADIQADGMAVDKLNTSNYYYTHVANYDLRPADRNDRVMLSKALLEKSLSLLNDAWLWATNIQTLPTEEQAANKNTNMYYFKKEWEKANGLKCGSNEYATLSSLLGYYNNLYSAIDGINTLIGVTVDWSAFGDSMYSPTIVGWEAANLVV